MVQSRSQAVGLASVLSMLLLGAASSAFAVDGVGMRVVRDPVTGQLRAPTAEELSAIEALEAKAAAAAPAPAVKAPPAVVERRTDGSAKLKLDESSMTYSVVTRNADGSLTEQCVTGAQAAHAIVSGKKTAGKNAKEHRHDHQ